MPRLRCCPVETFENNRAQHLRDMVHDHLHDLVSQCRIVLYIRPLIDLLISRYSQLTAYEDFPMDFEAFSAKNVTNPNLFWSRRLNPWFNAFGRANVSARGYIQKELTKQDVVLDFCNHMLALEPEGLENAQPQKYQAQRGLFSQR